MEGWQVNPQPAATFPRCEAVALTTGIPTLTYLPADTLSYGHLLA